MGPLGARYTSSHLCIPSCSCADSACGQFALWLHFERLLLIASIPYHTMRALPYLNALCHTMVFAAVDHTQPNKPEMCGPCR